MRILLRNKRTGLYYGGTGQWTEKPASAHDFKSGVGAVRHLLACCLDSVEFVYLAGDRSKGMILPSDSIQTRCE